MSLKAIDHPLIAHKISILRDKNTPSKLFRELVEEISMLMTFEITKDLKLKQLEVETPLKAIKEDAYLLDQEVIIVPILRAGLGMSAGMLKIIPNAKIGVIGMYRDEVSKNPVEYLVKLPEDLTNQQIIVVDPMLATAGSALTAITLLKQHGVNQIKFACLITIPEALKRLEQDHPDLEIYYPLAGLDDHLDERAYIVPGLGDAGDRLFGTE